jgi:histidine decarboxylase
VDRVDVEAVLGGLLDALELDRRTNIGFPGAVDDFRFSSLLAPFLDVLTNNYGDPYVDGIGGAHTKELEVEVVEFLLDLFGADVEDRWGHLTTGGSEANLAALRLARSHYPTGLVYFSAAAHDSVSKAVDILRMPSVTVRATRTGEIDYDDLRGVLAQRRELPAIIVANIGTTMTEAVDDVATIRRVLRDLAVDQHYIHADAALAGIPLAVADVPLGFGLAPGGAHSVTVSGHKFIGSPIPYGVLLTHRSTRNRIVRPSTYTGVPDVTISGSRSGLAPLLLWVRLHQLGWADGLAKRAMAAREVAEYAVQRLRKIGWVAWRHPLAFTVVLQTPPAEVRARWPLATHDGVSHLITMPGVTAEQIDQFVDALRASVGPRKPLPSGVGVPKAPKVRAQTHRLPGRTDRFPTTRGPRQPRRRATRRYLARVFPTWLELN